MLGFRFVLISIFLLAAIAAPAINPMTGKIVTIKDRQMIALQDFAEIFDATVDYHVDRDEISISLWDTTVYLVPYRMTAWVNDRKVWLDMPVVIVDETTFLPVRFICEAFGLRYDWAPSSPQVIIINQRTTERIVLIIDLDWYRSPRIWRYDYDLHWYVGFYRPCPHHHVTTVCHICPPPRANYTPYQNAHPPRYDNTPYQNANPPRRDYTPYQNTNTPQRDYTPYQNDNTPRRDYTPYQNDNTPQGKPPQHAGTGPQRPQYTPPASGSGQPGGWGKPNGNNQRDYGPPSGGYGQRTDRPDSNPSWNRDSRLADLLRSVGSPVNIGGPRKDVDVRPGGGYQQSGAKPQASGPRPGYQGKEQGNGRQEKESNEKGSEKDSGEKNGNGKGRDK
jgi:hypothetical protein